MRDIVQSLGKVSEIWLDPKASLREETLDALQVSTGFSRRQIELALTNCFEELNSVKMDEYLASFAQGKRSNVRKLLPWAKDVSSCVLHVLPSNAFTAWVHGAVITLLLGHRCRLKPSAREPIFARAWKASLEAVDTALSELVDIVAWDEKVLLECQAVIAYGSDESLFKIRARLPPTIRFAGFGHKLSVAIVFEEALRETSEGWVEQIYRDAEPFRLQGCLSPQILFIENFRGTRWPELDALLDVAPKIRPFEEWPYVLHKLGKFTPFLSTVGYAGHEERGIFLEKELRALDVSRICPLGQMQRPPLAWRNGGIDLANLLN